MTPSQEFVHQIKAIKDYWKDQSVSTEEKIDGVLFSVLNLIDGNSGLNNFTPLSITNTATNESLDTGCLHELYYEKN